MKKRSLATAVAATGVLFALATLPAEAALKSTPVSGTVNCNGSMVQYSTTRYMTGYSDTQVYVKAAAYSDGNWLGGPYTAMRIGVHINKTGANIDTSVTGADRWATMKTSAYMPNTAFVMRAAMESSVGTCHNSWSGTLYY